MDSTKAQAVIAKYNRFSNSIAAQESSQPSSSSSSSSSAIRATDENKRKRHKDDSLSELNKGIPPAYIPLHLDGGGKGDHHQRHRSRETTSASEEANEGAFAKSAFAVKKSLFAKSAFAVKKSLRPPPPPIPSAGNLIPSLDPVLFLYTSPLYPLDAILYINHLYDNLINIHRLLYPISFPHRRDCIAFAPHVVFVPCHGARCSIFPHGHEQL